MRCRVCGRPLTDPESQARGIGPTCRAHGRPVQFNLFEEVENANREKNLAVMGRGPVLLEAAKSLHDPSDNILGVVGCGNNAPWWRRVWEWVKRIIG
jgi:hypothetical protein